MEISVFSAESSLSLQEFLKRLDKLKNVQALDAMAVVGKKHIKVIVFCALKAFKEKRNISKSIKNEIALMAAGTRQISKAIELIGVKDPKNVVFVFLSEKKEKILRIFLAKEKRFFIDRENVVRLFGLDKKKDLEEQMIAKTASTFVT